MVKKTRENNTKTVSIYLLFIVIFTVHLYFICNTLDNEFLRYDDIQNYVANPLIKNGIGLKTLIFDIWTDKSIILGVYEPISQLIKMFVISLFGNARYSHIIVSSLLHALSISIMYVITIKMLEKYIYTMHRDTNIKDNDKKDKKKSKRDVASKTMSAHIWIHFHIFLLCGLSRKRVEILSWASCNGYTNSLLFTSIAMYYYINNRAAGLFLIFYTMAVLSKAVALPVILLPIAYDYIVKKRLKIKGGMLFLYIGTTLTLMYTTIFANRFSDHDNDSINVVGYEMLKRFYTACKFYMYDVHVSSTDMCVHYFMPSDTTMSILSKHCILQEMPNPTTIMFITLMVLLIYLCQIVENVVKYLFISLAILSPVLLMSSLKTHGTDNGGIVHVRYVYLLEALITYPFLSFLTVKIMSNNNNNDNKYTNNSKAKAFITKTITKYTSMLKKTILSILFLLTISSLQSLNLEYKKWKNTNVLWTDAIKKNDNDYYAHHGLAENLAQKCTQNLKHCKIKNLKKAIYHMKKSMKVKVTNNAAFNLGMMHGMLMDKCIVKRNKRCIEKYINGTFSSLNNRTKLDLVFDNLISSFTKESDYTFLENLFKSFHDPKFDSSFDMLKICKDKSIDSIYFALGKFYHTKQKYAEALTHYANALKIYKENPTIWANQGEVMRRLNVDLQFVYSSYEKALELDKTNTDALYGIGILKYKEKKHKESVKYFKRIYRQNPNDISSLFVYANVMANIDVDESLLLFEEIKLKSRNDKSILEKVEMKIKQLKDKK